MQEEVKFLGLTGLGNIALWTLLIRGHLQQGHIDGALNFFKKNVNTLRQNPAFSNHIDFDNFKTPYANITPYDILYSLHNSNFISYSPEEIFNEMQRQIDEVYRFVLKLIDYVSNPNNSKYEKGIKLVESDNRTPLFGLKGLLNYKITSVEQAKALLTCFGWGLGDMDSFEHRYSTGLPFGGGINVPLNLNNLPNGKNNLWHDTITLSQIHLPEELNINKPEKIEYVMDIFYSQILNPLKKIVLVMDRGIQAPNVTDGYVIILRGPGSADFMSIYSLG